MAKKAEIEKNKAEWERFMSHSRTRIRDEQSELDHDMRTEGTTNDDSQILRCTSTQ